MKKIVIIWHAAVKTEYQKLILSVASVARVSKNEMTFFLITPKAWREGSEKKLKAETFVQNTNNSFFTHIKLTTFFSGISKHYYPFLNRTLKKIDPDMIDLIEEPESLVAFQVQRYCSKKNIPFLFNSALNQEKSVGGFARLIEKKTFRTCSGGIFRNSITQKILKKKGFVKPSVLIGNGIDPSLFKPQAFNSSFFKPLSRKLKTIGYVGRLVEEKGIFWLIETLEKHLKNERFNLMIAGGGNLFPKIKKKLQNFSKNTTKLFPPLSPEKLVTFYNACDILVVPSLKTPTFEEPFGRVVVEAMACETIVFGSSSGEIPKIINHKDFVFSAGNQKDFVSKITNNFLVKNNKQIKIKNRLKVKQYFWDELSKKRLSFYRSILSDF